MSDVGLLAGVLPDLVALVVTMHTILNMSEWVCTGTSSQVHMTVFAGKLAVHFGGT